MSSKREQTPAGRIIDTLEESMIAILLGLMTILTFVNVLLRYVFNTGLIWGLEVVTTLFAWMVILGVSYGVKITAHLGVDALTAILPPKVRRAVALLAAFLCVFYAFLLLKGGWDFWANFGNLPKTSGRWFPTGFQEMRPTSYRAWYITENIPMLEFLRFIEAPMNQGETYDKLPRFIPYVVMPVGFALLLLRSVQAFWRVWRGDHGALIVSHEAEDAIQALNKPHLKDGV